MPREVSESNMVGRYIIEDEYTINVRVKRDANSTHLSSPAPLTLNCSDPFTEHAHESFSELSLSPNDSTNVFTLNYRYSDPAVSDQWELSSQENLRRGSLCSPTSFTLVPPPNAHVKSADATHFVNGVPTRANLFVHGGSDKESLTKKVVCEGAPSRMCEVGSRCSPQNNLNCGLQTQNVFERSPSRNSNIVAPCVERKSSKVKMLVTSEEDRKSPTFKPISGFASPNCQKNLNDTCSNESKTFQFLSSLGEVIPLKPTQGFIIPSKTEEPVHQDPYFYTEHSSPVPSCSQEPHVPKAQALPSVRVFDNENLLVSKNIFSTPKDKKVPDIKPKGPGSLFVKPIKQHCASGNGELYVAPVDTKVISASRKVPTLPLKGNSRRKKSKGELNIEESHHQQQTKYKKSNAGEFSVPTYLKPHHCGVQFLSRSDSSEYPKSTLALKNDRTREPVVENYYPWGFQKSDHGSQFSEKVRNQNGDGYNANVANNKIINSLPIDGNNATFQNPNYSSLSRDQNDNISLKLGVKYDLKATTPSCTTSNGYLEPTSNGVYRSKISARTLLSKVINNRMYNECPAPETNRSYNLRKSVTTDLTDFRSHPKSISNSGFPSQINLNVSFTPPPNVNSRRNLNSVPRVQRDEIEGKIQSSSLLRGHRRSNFNQNSQKNAEERLFKSLSGDCVPDGGGYTTSVPGSTLTSGGGGGNGHDPREVSSPSSIDPDFFFFDSEKNPEIKSEIMLVTNEPVSGGGPRLPLPTQSRNYNANTNDFITPDLIGHSRGAKYLADVSPPHLTLEGCENLGFDASFGGQENPGFDSSFGYLPFTESRSLDPGYVSERSEEEEEEDDDDEEEEGSSSSGDEGDSQFRHSFLEPPQGIRLDVEYLMKIFPFINEGSLFDVTVVKNSRGLGLALTGGIECESLPLPGLIRIRKIYPQTPAWLCGQLNVNDFILEANGNQLTGLTSHEALEMLRIAGGEVSLVLCRAPEVIMSSSTELCQTDFKENGIVTTSLTAPQSITRNSFLSPSPSLSTCGEFEIQLKKVAGSLGFTLRKNDNSILGHTIRSLVKEPAISDGRLRPGDKLLSVNGTDMCGLSHEEAVQFLRTCPETVIIRIYRDAMQTPVSPASPTEPEFSKPKALRKEARDMLTDLAFRKQTSPNPSNGVKNEAPNTPRRRRLNKNSPESKIERWESLVRKAEADANPFHNRESSPFDNSHSDTLTACSSRSGTVASRSSSTNSYKEISRASSPISVSNSSCSESRPRRPNFLDLNNSHNSSKKSQFTPPHEEEGTFPSPPLSRQYDSLDSAPQLTSAHSDTPAFSHLQSCYRSVNATSSLAPFEEQQHLTNTSSDHNISSHAGEESPGKKNALLKWKGVVFTPEVEKKKFDSLSGSEEGVESQESQNVVTLELTRGWNSRLGFSLQNCGNDTIIVAIYADSVAARDGRLKVGDVILEVNGNDVRSWDSQGVIDLLRKTRGKIYLKILQK